MTNSKNTRRALLISVLTMTLSFVMLIGTTFAWFTDSVSSGKNRIVSGNLDVELYKVDGNNETLVTKDTNIFMEDGLWEPGRVEVINLKIVNAGSLALKYQLGINIAKEVKGINVYGEELQLSKYIKYALLEGNKTYTDRKDAIDAAKTTSKPLSELTVNEKGVLYAEGTEGKESLCYVTLIVYMPETVENEANYRKNETNTNAPEINLGVTLVATQYNFEEDSFNSDYDKDLKLPDVVVSNTTSLVEAVKNVEAGAVIQVESGTYEEIGTFVIDKDVTLLGENGAIMDGAVLQIKEKANVTIENIDFVGDSYIHNQGMKSLTMKDCDVDVNVPTNVNNGRAAFISLGSNENQGSVKLDIQNNTFKVKSNKDSFVAAIFGWTYIEDGSVISGNTFGSEDSRYKFIAVKLMNFVDGATIAISNNTIYGTTDNWDFCGFDLYQNNSRDNKYTANFSGNSVNVIGTAHEGCFLWLEANNGKKSATVNIDSTNTYNGTTVTIDHCDVDEAAGSVNFN